MSGDPVRSSTPTGANLVGCLIVKDEARFITDCLVSMRQLCSTIVVVDTGSSDATVELAEQHADVVEKFDMGDDFSAARNIALDIVDEGDWVFFLDADERLHESQVSRLRAAVDSVGDDIGAVTLRRYNFFPDGGFYTGLVPKVFRRHPEIRYERKVNESVKPAVERAGLRIANSGALLTHIGHCRPRAERDAKALRYMELMHKQLAARPDDPVLTAYIGLNLRMIGCFAEADDFSARAVSMDPDHPLVLSFRGHVLRALGRADEAARAYERSMGLQPSDASAMNMLALCHAAAGRVDEADRLLSEAARLDPTMVHVDVNRGLIAQSVGEHERAIELFRDAARRFPPLLVEEPAVRLEVDPLHVLLFETPTGYAGLGRHLAYSEAVVSGSLIPDEVSVGHDGATPRKSH